jgi:hypothetical protein
MDADLNVMKGLVYEEQQRGAAAAAAAAAAQGAAPSIHTDTDIHT